MKSKLFILYLFLAGLWISCSEKQTTEGMLPRSTPEKEGVSSQSILNFLTAVDTSRSELHSFMLLRHGKVIAEGWWNPYEPELKHTMYSVSKSFASTAIGYAVSEGLLSVEDKVVSFFPEYLPDTVSPFLAAMSVKNLLCMSTGQDRELTFEINKSDSWAQAFLNTPLAWEPGSKFAYNSIATYMLSAIVQKVTGQKIMDYLTPRLFTPLRISAIDWETDPEGINTGGWGLRLKTEDMAKFGQLLLQKGEWQGKQVLSAGWIAEATAKQIDQRPDLTEEQKAGNDGAQGYGYQFWRCQHNAFRADGAFGQFIIVMPDQDAVLAVTSSSQNLLNLVWEHLLPALQKEGELPVDKKTAAELKHRLSSLALPVPGNGVPAPAGFIGKTFLIEPNDKQIVSIKLSPADDKGKMLMSVEADGKVNDIAFGSGEWQWGEVYQKSPYLVPYQSPALQPFKVAGAYLWKEDNHLELMLRYIETPHYEVYDFVFGDAKIGIKIWDSLGKVVQLEGEEVKN